MSEHAQAAHQRDESVDLAVYVGLLILTVVTVAASWFHLGKIFAVATAVVIAATKASLIGLYFMDLRSERPLMHVILWSGIVLVGILLVGLIPDLALKW